jgi:hypothetical protein
MAGTSQDGGRLMSKTGIDDALRLDAVYLSAPIPRNLAVLTVLGAVFDRVYFPGVYLPKGGYDPADLDTEIARLEALPDAGDYDTQLLIGILKLAKHAKALENFCEFTADPDDPFGQKTPIPPEMVQALYNNIHGPPRPGFIPTISPRYVKGLPGGDEAVIYPGDLHYLAGAIIESGKQQIPLLNDIPDLPIPGVKNIVPANNAKLLAGVLAIECTKIALPPTPLLRVEDLVEFRAANAGLLRGFRRSMLRYAADLNGRIKDLTREDFETHTKFFIETEIVPAMDELNTTMNDPARPWHKRAIDMVKIVPQIGGAFLMGGPTAAIAKAITATASQFFAEVAAKGDKNEALKHSGLTYLLRLKAFHDARS